MGTLPLAIFQGTASHTRQEAQAVLSGTAAPVWAPARTPRGTVHVPTSLSYRQIEPGIPCWKEGQGLCLNGHILVHRGKNFLETEIR